MLDLATLLTISGTLAIFLAAALSYTMDVAAPRSLRSLRIWQGALLCNATFWFLYLGDFRLFPGALPFWLAVVSINVVSLAAILGYVWAMRLFLKLPPHRPLLVGLLAVSATGNFFLSTVLNEYWLRLVLNLGITSMLMLWLAASLWQCREEGIKRSARMTMVVFIAGSFAILARFYDLIFALDSIDAQSLPGQTLALLGYALVPCFATLGFLLMHVGRASHHLERLAATDPLTGACNRRSLETAGRRMLSAARRHGEPVSVLMIDADRFKSINDQHGHEAGDVALVSMMETLSRTLRNEDVIGRIGGEEFVVLLPNTDDAGALEVAERVRRAMQSHIIDENRLPFSLTISVGVATTAGGRENLDDLIHQADNGLYEAKAQGRNRVIHYAMVRPRLTPVA